MSATTYRKAVTRYRETLDLLGPYRGPCGLCGWVDARHRSADALSGAILAGETAEEAADEYLSIGVPARVVLEVTVAVLDADPRRHWLARARADAVDREVWADLTETREHPHPHGM